MKFRLDKNYALRAFYNFIVLVAAILLFTIVNNISSIWGGVAYILKFLKPVAYGILFALILNPILRFYENKVISKIQSKRLRPVQRRIISLILTIITVVALIVVMFCLFIPQLIEGFGGLIQRLPEYAEKLNSLIKSATDSQNEFHLLEPDSEVTKLLNNFLNQFTSSLSSVGGNIDSWISTALSHVLSLGAQMATGVVNWIFGLLISIYLLFDREKLFAQVRKISVALFPDRVIKWVYEVIVEAGQIFKGFMVGKVIGSLLLGIICTIGMLILRIPYPVPIGVLICITNIFPYFGPFIGAILGTLLILLVNPFKALLFLIFVVVLQQFDNNVLEPKILGGRIGLSALWVVISVLLFGGLFGVGEMFLGVPAFAIIYAVVKKIIAYLLMKTGKSADTGDYASESNPLIK